MTTTNEGTNVTPIKQAPAKATPGGTRAAKKEQAAAKKAAAPAKKAAAPAEKKKPEGPQQTRSEYKKLDGKDRYMATGRGGKINVRNFDKPMAFAVDVADPEGRTEEARKGLIYRFYPDKDKAEAFAAKKREEGYDAIVVPAKKFEG